MTPTQRTLQRLRKCGYLACVVEKWLPHTKTRQDAFGAFDVLAVRADKPGVLGVQCTSASNVSARVKKLLALPAVRVWLAAGNRASVWGWKKVKSRWQVRQVELRQEECRVCDEVQVALASEGRQGDV